MDCTLCVHQCPHRDTISLGCVVTLALGILVPGHFGLWARLVCRILASACSGVSRVSVRFRCVEGPKGTNTEVSEHQFGPIYRTSRLYGICDLPPQQILYDYWFPLGCSWQIPSPRDSGVGPDEKSDYFWRRDRYVLGLYQFSKDREILAVEQYSNWLH